MKIMPHEGKRILQLSMGEESEQHQYALRRLMVGFLRLDAIQEHVDTRVCLSCLSTCSDMLLHVCVTHASLQSFDPSDQGLPHMKRSFDSRVSLSIQNGLEIGVVKPLATSVLVSTITYLEMAAKVPRVHSNLLLRS